MKIIIAILLLVTIYSCNNKQNNISQSSFDNDTIIVKYMQIKHANGFKVDYYKNYKKISVLNPWENNSVYWEYYIVNHTSLLKPNSNGKFYILSNSLNSVLQLSGTQISMFKQLGIIDNIKAVADKKHLFNEKILAEIEKGDVIELGSEQNLNIEKLISENINSVFTTGWDKVSDSFIKLTNLGIPIIYSLDWQEQSPLARAEWIKFIASFYNKEIEAEKYFNKIENKYLTLKNIAAKTKNKPSVFNGNSISGTWYVAGSDSYLVKLFTHAGANYIFSNNNSKGSVPLSFETVYTKAVNADYWIASGNADFTGTDERYKMFKAYKTNNIYLNNNRINSTGGNDYWESGVIHPELVLQDFINIFHPSLNNDTIPRYYKQLSIK